MFGLGFTEILLILVAIIICIKPTDYKFVVKSLFKLYRQLDQLMRQLLNKVDLYGDD